MRLFENKDYEAFDAYNAYLIELVKDDETFKRFQTPISMYVTFGHQETKERLHWVKENGWSGHRALKFLGHPMRLHDIAEPNEPSDLDRKNDTIKRRIVTRNLILYTFLTIVILVTLLGLQSVMRYKIMDLSQKYPVFIDCAPLHKKTSDAVSFKAIAELDL